MPKRAKLTAEIVAQIFEPSEKAAPVYPYDLKYKRQTYRIPETMHAEIVLIAHENGIGIGDLVRWIFQQFLNGHASGTIELPIEEYVVTKSRLSA